MTSHVTGPRGRAVIPVLVVVLGIGLGAGGMLSLRPFGGPAATSSSSLTGQSAAKPLHPQAVYRRLKPSVVDVTSTLRYDDETASGTGFVVDGGSALVLTNNHVVRDATSVTVTVTSTGRSYPGEIVGVDVGADIAVLRLKGAAGLTAAPIGNSAGVTLGSQVLAIGNQAGEDGPPALAAGIINGVNRTIRANDGTSGFTETLHDMLQTSAAIEPGDSGGPLANAAGAVVGVDTAAGTGSVTAGYAIPVNSAMAIARQIAAGHAGPGITLGVAGFLGVVVPSTSIPSPRLQARAEHGLAPGGAAGRAGRMAAGTGTPGRAGGAANGTCLGTKATASVPATVAPARSGALVDGVLCGTGAAAGGIAAGDVIIAAAGQAVTSPDALTAIIGTRHPGALVSVTWVTTSGAIKNSMIAIGAAPAALSRTAA